MKKIGEIMEEMGFKKDAPIETQKAFIRHLIRQAYGVPVEELAEKPRSQCQQLELPFINEMALVHKLPKSGT